MKINPPTENPVAISSNTASLAAKSGPAASLLAKTDATKSAQSPGVAVTVSRLARALNADNSGEAADVDAAKVAAVRTAIAQGTYQVNPEAIADKLLSNAQEMLQRSRA